MVAANEKAERLFIELLGNQGSPVSSAKNSQYYAPKAFTKHSFAKSAGIGQGLLGAAMERLLESGRVVRTTERTAHGGGRERLVLKEEDDSESVHTGE
jgi:hypothetical protein